MPIFLALFRLLDQRRERATATAFLTDELAEQLRQTPSCSAIADLGDVPRRPTATSRVMILAAILVLAMTATTFTTQRQLMSKNMPADALTGPYAQQQKMLLYVLPVVFAVGGVAFPIGVLLYWTTSNLWTMGQQFYVIRNNPAPGTAGVRRRRRSATRAKAAKHGQAAAPRPTVAAGRAEPRSRRRRPQQRQQPKKQSREQRKKSGKQPRDQAEARRRAPTSSDETQ